MLAVTRRWDGSGRPTRFGASRRGLGLLLAGAIAHSAPPSVEWRSVGPGGGGWIQSIRASPHAKAELFVGCDVGGFYYSGDAGNSYTIRNQGLRDYWVECILPHPANPDIIYIGCEGGVYKSIDRGRGWQWLRNGFPAKARYRWSAPVGALALDPSSPDTLYAGIGRPRRLTFGKGAVYKTNDGGASWARVNESGSLPKDAWITDLVVHPQDGRRVYLACQYGVFQSTDGGVSWRRTITGLPHGHVRRIALCASRPEVLYLTLRSPPGQAPWQGGVYRSTDGGETWRARTAGLRQQVGKPGAPAPMTANYDRIVVHPGDPDTVYVGGMSWVNATVFKTTDGGQSWRDTVRRGEDGNIDLGWITFWVPTVTCLTLSPIDPEVLFFGTSGMVYRTENGGDTWRQAYSRALSDGRIRGTGLETTCLHGIVVDPRNPLRVFFGFADIGLLITEDGGNTLRRSVTGVNPRPMRNSCFTVAVDPDDGNHLWAAFGSWSSNLGGLAESLDGGRSWSMLAGPEGNGLPKAQNRVLIVDETTPAARRRLFTLAKTHGVHVSDDGGRNWQPRNAGLASNHVVGLVRHPRRPGVFWCVTCVPGKSAAVVYRSDDACLTWRPASGSPEVAKVTNLVISSGDSPRLYLAARSASIGERRYAGGVFRSNDGGEQWQHILDDDFVQGLAADPRDPDVLYAGLTDHPYHDESTGDGIAMTGDGGSHWVSLNSASLTNRHINCIAVDPANPRRLYLGTGGNAVFAGDITEVDWRRFPALGGAEP